MRVLVLQHIACEPPGIYEDVLNAHGAELVRVEVDEGEALLDLGSFDRIVAMGGPMSVNDEAEQPWLVDEKRLIASAVRAGVPFWGVCLGVQLLASSMGARVYPGDQPEVGGWIRIHDSGPLDAAGMLSLLDAWPAPILTLLHRQAPASTVTWMVNLLAAPPPEGWPELGWWRFHGSTVAAGDGYADITGRLWGPDGNLVATSRQLVAEFSGR